MMPDVPGKCDDKSESAAALMMMQMVRESLIVARKALLVCGATMHTRACETSKLFPHHELFAGELHILDALDAHQSHPRSRCAVVIRFVCSHHA
jgi:hypothetical protein